MREKTRQSRPRAVRLPAALALLLATACAAGQTQPEVGAPAPGPTQPGGASVAPEVRPQTTAGAVGREAGAGEPARGMAFVIFGSDTVRAEVASTPAQRSQGLMGRPSVPAGTGMLFVFDDEELRSFWMRNTLVSLDIAFFDSELRIVDIQQMEAGSEDFHDSARPAMYALEVPEGWLAAQGIRVGDQARIVIGR